MWFFYIPMIHECHNDPVRVFSLFDGRKVKPYFFEWGGRRYEVDNVLNVHSKFEGRERVHFFSVANQSEFFNLKFHTEKMEWYLVEHFQE